MLLRVLLKRNDIFLFLILTEYSSLLFIFNRNIILKKKICWITQLDVYNVKQKQ